MKNQYQKERQRKLTKSEQQRKEKFQVVKEELESNGYVSHNLTIGLVYANVMAIVLGMPIALLLTAWFFIKHPVSSILLQIDKVFLAFVLLVLLIVIHELIHGIFWGIFAKNHWKSISFGFILQYLTPYCSCSQPLNKVEYIIGAIMPTILLGIFPSIISIFIGSALTFIIGIVMIFAGGGDLAIIFKLLRFQNRAEDILYLDHPYQAVLVAFTK